MSKDNSALSSSSWMVGLKFVERIFSLVIYIFLARLLTVEEFGVVAFSILILEFVAVFTSSGVKDYILTSKDISKPLINTCIFSVIGVSLTISLAFYFSMNIVFADKSDLMKDVFEVLIFLPLISSFNIVQTALVQRRKEFKKLSLRGLFSNVVAGFVGLFFAFKGLGAWALVIQQYVRVVLDTVILQFIVKYIPTFDMSFTELKACYRFSIPLLASEVMNFGSNRLMDIFVSVFHGVSSLAILNISRKFTRLVQQLSLTSLRPVVLSYMTSSNNSSEVFAKFVGYLTFVVAPILIAIGVYAEFYIPHIFGEQWKPAISIVELLSLTALAQCLAWYFNLLLIDKKRTGLVFKLNLIFTAVYIVVGLACYNIPFEQYILVQVVAINVVSILKIGYLIYQKYLRLSDFQNYILPAIFSSLMFGALSFMTSKFIVEIIVGNSWLEPVAAIALSVVNMIIVFTVSLVIFKEFKADFFYLLRAIMQSKKAVKAKSKV
ncbi:Polysaccharide biosynthesis family protein [Alteromonas macleodii]